MILLTLLNWLLFVTASYWTLALGCLLVLFAISNRDQPALVLKTDLAKEDMAENSAQTEPSEATSGEGCAINDETPEAVPQAALVATEEEQTTSEVQAPAPAAQPCCPNLFVVDGLVEPQQQACY